MTLSFNVITWDPYNCKWQSIDFRKQDIGMAKVNVGVYALSSYKRAPSKVVVKPQY